MRSAALRTAVLVHLDARRRVRAAVEPVVDTVAITVERATVRVDQRPGRCVEALVHAQAVVDTVAVAVEEASGLVDLDPANGARSTVDFVGHTVSVRIG